MLNRLSPIELYALEKAAEILPSEAKGFLFGSRTNIGKKGGDIDFLVLVDLRDDLRFELSTRIAMEFFRYCEEKIDVVVLPLSKASQEQAAFLKTLKLVSLQEVLNTPRLDHVALLVESLEESIKRCSRWGFIVGAVEEFQSEGTRECYIGEPGRPSRLLLIEAISPGPYKSALAKRGPGLHHLALNVRSQAAFFKTMEESGWRCHPADKHWLFHRNACTLLETKELANLPARELQPVVTEVQVKWKNSETNDCPSTQTLQQVIYVTNSNPWIRVGTRQIDIDSIVRANAPLG